jgi:hypothetical protein
VIASARDWARGSGCSICTTVWLATAASCRMAGSSFRRERHLIPAMALASGPIAAITSKPLIESAGACRGTHFLPGESWPDNCHLAISAARHCSPWRPPRYTRRNARLGAIGARSHFLDPALVVGEGGRWSVAHRNYACGLNRWRTRQNRAVSVDMTSKERLPICSRKNVRRNVIRKNVKRKNVRSR